MRHGRTLAARILGRGMQPSTPLDETIHDLLDKLEVMERNTYSEGIRVRAWMLGADEYRNIRPSEMQAHLRGMFPQQQVYTHIDVFSPPEFGEHLLYRVKL